MNAHPSRALRGFLLLEVVVALLLFSLGLLGMVQLQARASQLSVDAEDRSRAALLANELVASMWAQRTVQVDNATLLAWQTKVADTAAAGQPAGRAQLVIDTADPRLAVIRIDWKPDTRDPDVLLHRYITSVTVPNPVVAP